MRKIEIKYLVIEVGNGDLVEFDNEKEATGYAQDLSNSYRVDCRVFRVMGERLLTPQEPSDMDRHNGVKRGDDYPVTLGW